MLYNIVKQLIFYETNGKNLVWSYKNSGEIHNKLKSKGFLASNLSTYDFPILYTTLTLSHNLITEILSELIKHNTDHLTCLTLYYFHVHSSE